MDDRERWVRGAESYSEVYNEPEHDLKRRAAYFKGACDEARHWKERVNQLERTVSFFASVIKSGESWSSACEAEMELIRAGKEKP